MTVVSGSVLRLQTSLPNLGRDNHSSATVPLHGTAWTFTLKARVLTTNIDLDEGTCSLDLLESASGFFGLTLAQARAVIKEVAAVTATWRDTAKAVGARSAEISRMASAFEHDDLTRALTL